MTDPRRERIGADDAKPTPLELEDVITRLAPGRWRLAAAGNPDTGNVVIVIHIFCGPSDALRTAAGIRSMSSVNEPVAALLERSARQATSTEGTA
jgi:hypothetical protein